MKNLTSIRILPIYDQSAGVVWKSFANIKAECMRTNYGIRYNKKDILDDVKEMRNCYENDINEYAIAAYHKQKMVGCIRGAVREEYATVERVCVLPEYQHQQIGSKLLRAASNIAHIEASDIVLPSFAGAAEFYQGKSSDNGCERPINTIPATAEKCSEMPIVFSGKTTVKKVADIIAAHTNGNTKYGKDSIRNMIMNHVPMAAWIDNKGQISSVGIKKGGKIEVYFPFGSCQGKFLEHFLEKVK